jgi:hypothetical protein
MKDPASPRQHLIEPRTIGDATFHDTHSGISRCRREIASDPADEVVEHDDFPNGLGEELVHDVRSDETGAADDDNLLTVEIHDLSLRFFPRC